MPKGDSSGKSPNQNDVNNKTISSGHNPLNVTSASNTLGQTFGASGANLAGVDGRAFKFMQDMLKDHENRIESLLDIIDEKVDRNVVEAMISDKVAKDEI